MTSDTDWEALLARSGTVPPAHPDTLARARMAMTREIEVRVAEKAPGSRQQAARTWRRQGAWAVAAVVVAFAVLAGPVFRGGTPGATAQAQEVFMRAANSAAVVGDTAAQATYWHVVALYQQDNGPQHRRESWIGRTGGVFSDDGLGVALAKMDRPLFGSGNPGFDWDAVRALPSDPSRLRSLLLDDSGTNDPRSLLGVVGAMLRDSPASSAVRRALWEVAATIPGVALLGPAPDSLGRVGQVVEVRNSAGFRRFVIDVEHGVLLEEKSGNNDVEHAGFAFQITLVTQEGAQSAPIVTARS